jgi:hypothetical protein
MSSPFSSFSIRCASCGLFYQRVVTILLARFGIIVDRYNVFTSPNDLWFAQELFAIDPKFPLSHIVSVEESMWLVFWKPRESVAEKGVESMKVKINGHTNAGFTLIGSMAANGDRLPSFLIAKGVTFRCQKQFGRPFPRSIDHAKSRWSIRNSFSDSSLSSVQTAGWVRMISFWISIQLIWLRRHMERLANSASNWFELQKGELPITSLSIAGSPDP